MRFDSAAAVYVGTTAVNAVYLGARQIWTAHRGPIRPKTPALPRGIVLGGHSSLQVVNHNGILGAVGPVMSDGDRQSSQEAWESNGPARTADYDMLIVSESDSYSTLYEGVAAPDTPEGRNNLQHLYWLGLEAKDRGAEFVLFNSPSSQYHDVDAQNRARMNYYRQWLETHLDMPIWLIPGELYVQELRDRGLTNSDIFQDAVHLRPGPVSEGAAYQAVAFVTGALPAGATGIHAEAALASVQRYWWSGLGGSDYEAGLDIEDPLPSPDPRPGTGPVDPDPIGDIVWTPEGLVSPVQPIGAQPTTVDGNLRFSRPLTGHSPSFPMTNSGYYAIFRMRVSGTAGLGAIIYANPDPSDLFADPFTAFGAASGPAMKVERWPEGIEHQVGTLPVGEWVTVETWSIGAQMGARIGDGPDVAAPGVPGSFGPTSHLALFHFWDGASYYDVSRLAVRLAMPTEQERADLRAWATA